MQFWNAASQSNLQKTSCLPLPKTQVNCDKKWKRQTYQNMYFFILKKNKERSTYWVYASVLQTQYVYHFTRSATIDSYFPHHLEQLNKLYVCIFCSFLIIKTLCRKNVNMTFHRMRLITKYVLLIESYNECHKWSYISLLKHLTSSMILSWICQYNFLCRSFWTFRILLL